MGNSNVFLPSSGSPRTPWNKSESSLDRTRTILTKTLAVFRLADNWFGVDIALIERVVPIDYLTRLTSDCGAILGTVGIENHLVSVVDLSFVLGIGHSQPEVHSSILVSRVPSDGIGQFGSSEIGILADEFVDVFFVPARQILRYLENDDSAFEQVIAGECVCGDRTISVVNVAGIIRVLNSTDVAVPA